uniref:Uncharacterized protein n=1 Tax=Rhizophora mucronata TaxID=61149 RepID=A0A2P2INW6_RHIMU
MFGSMCCFVNHKSHKKITVNHIPLLGTQKMLRRGISFFCFISLASLSWPHFAFNCFPTNIASKPNW